MEEIPILVKPIDYPLTLANVLKCIWCGSTIFRIQEEWGILKDEFIGADEGQYPSKVARTNINFYCAVCGKMLEGYELIENYKVEVGEFDCSEDAKDHLTWLEEKEKNKQ